MKIKIYTQANDYSTDGVIDWFAYYGIPFERQNSSDALLNLKEPFCIDLSKSDLQQYSAVWNRRPLRSLFYKNSIIENDLLHVNRDKAILPHINHMHALNVDDASEYLALNHPYAKILGTFNKNNVNKHIVLAQAIKEGIDVPASIYTNSKDSLLAFRKNHTHGIITKMNAVVMMDYDNNSKTMALYTELVSDEFLDSLPDTFFPTFFQEKLEKAFEIRTFYLDGKFYSMAMFSQLNDQTKVDFRRYDRDNMNRRVPYNLPKNVEEKITQLMQTIGHNTGSIDIVKTVDGRFVFLEVNPVGQFGMTSQPCNYQLEKHIAEYLINQ